MGNVVEAIEREIQSSLAAPESQEQETPTKQEDDPENIIDLDSAEYKQWLQTKREKEGASRAADKCRSKKGSKCFIRVNSHCKRVKPLAEQPRTTINAENPPPAQIRLPKNNSQEFRKRNVESDARIEETRRKYNLKDREYRRRGSVVLILDDKRALKRENEERQRRRQQMRIKYQIPSHRPRQQVTVG